MSLQNIGIGVAVVLSVIAIALGIVGFGGSHPAGNLTQTNLQTFAPSSATSFVGPYGVEADAGFFDAAGAVSKFLGEISMGSNVTTPTYNYQVLTGSCANAASSTLFAVKSPIGTSTVQVFITVGGNATTSSLLVGTSTTPNYVAASSIQSIDSTNGIATSSVQTAYSGVNDVLAGMIAAGANTEKTIVVGPTQYVVGGSTSTATGAGAAQYSPNFSTCSYQIRFEN